MAMLCPLLQRVDSVLLITQTSLSSLTSSILVWSLPALWSKCYGEVGHEMALLDVFTRQMLTTRLDLQPVSALIPTLISSNGSRSQPWLGTLPKADPFL